MAGAGKGPIDPLHQFEVHPIFDFQLFGYDVSFTNASLWMMFGFIAIVGVMVLGTRRPQIVPSRFQSLAELSYEFVEGIVVQNAGKEGLKYFPFIFTLFMFILAANILGLLPYSFTVTSHIAVTGVLGILVITVITLIGIARHGLHFFSLFVPSGVPAPLLLLLIPIEIISYLVRPFSLAVRLFANMVAGHMMLKVFAGFVIMLGVAGGWLPLIAMVGLFALELLVAFLQAYVFALLTSIYLNDAIHLH